ncbi:uncharacterized protein LOC106657222 [Trichogramma pretiosum]|uniref:uncharacterized protein LOC106657222 n=1 Tax=Trichogramma pretiosum TaxID=7493 RepID=UPI0006C98FF8|nr:uncharacterized protein LOC106657222 [Trichogramma pretiosum]
MSGSRYEPWHARHRVQSLHLWCNPEHLVQRLVKARTINFYIKQERRSVYLSLGCVTFDVNKRFPDRTTLVNTSEGRCAELLDQIHHSLNVVDALLEDYAIAHQAAKEYMQAVHSLLSILSSLGNKDFDPEAYNIHDRASFEKKYSLTWVEKPPTTPVEPNLSLNW